ncbi:MAG TPA: hypothetical protein VFM70_06675 [Salinimicrobium sp.]|nr:hypothetical protein [Salinimicrobium sp.]
MRKLLFFVAVSISAMSFSQERYRVVYDYNTENISYYLLNEKNEIADTLSKPRIKRNSLVEIELQNVNPFAVNVVSDVKEETIHQSGQGFNFGSLLGGINAFSGDKLNLNVQNLPTDTLFTGKSRGQGVVNKFSDLNEIVTNISAVKTTLVSNLLNPNLDKETILENLKEVAGMQADARLSDPNENFYLYLSNVEKVVQTDKQAIMSDISAMANEISSEEMNDAPVSRGELIARNSAFADLQELMASLESSTTATTEDINKIKSLYAALEASSFSRTYDYQMESDKVNIEMKFLQSDFSQESDMDNAVTTLKTRNIQLFAKGGFKINSSIALTLNNFGSSSKNFYIDEENIIGAEKNDFFTPNLSTMINFYPMMGENFNLGGSFGISIPISSDISGINFLFGPSIFLGSKSRLALSGGLAFGPVTRLTDGLAIGDETISNDIENITRSVYDFGYFFGISFSLFDIN